jgi:hypothetical protein
VFPVAFFNFPATEMRLWYKTLPGVALRHTLGAKSEQVVLDLDEKEQHQSQRVSRAEISQRPSQEDGGFPGLKFHYGHRRKTANFLLQKPSKSPTVSPTICSNLEKILQNCRILQFNLYGNFARFYRVSKFSSP